MKNGEPSQNPQHFYELLDAFLFGDSRA
eukprot:SAG11_NODE_33746_length_275_cov_1.369318_1_plen_27_part_10